MPPAAKRLRVGEPLTATFDDLSNELLLCVASFVGPVPTPAAIDVEEEHDPTTMISIKDARRLWGSFATLSRDWKVRVNICLSPALLVDADLYGVRHEDLFSSFLWLTKNAIPLGKFRVQTANYSTNFVARILRSCDMLRLKHVEVIVASTDKCRLLNGMYARGFLTEEEPEEPMSIFELHQEIARRCPVVRRLKINCIAPTASKPVAMSRGKYDGLHHGNMRYNFGRSLLTLRHLSFGVHCGRIDYSNKMEAAKLLKAVVSASQQAPGLESLVLGMGSQNCQEALEIQSKSLKLIDVINCGKHLWITKCVCPSLELFKCRGTVFGNGVRVSDPREYVLDDLRRVGSFTVGSTPFYGMRVPDTCIVELDYY